MEQQEAGRKESFINDLLGETVLFEHATELFDRRNRLRGKRTRCSVIIEEEALRRRTGNGASGVGERRHHG